MEFIADLDNRPYGKLGRAVRWARFRCTFCGTLQELPKHNGLRKTSCGCVRGMNEADDQAFKDLLSEVKFRPKTRVQEIISVLKELEERKLKP